MSDKIEIQNVKASPIPFPEFVLAPAERKKVERDEFVDLQIESGAVVVLSDEKTDKKSASDKGKGSK